MREDKRMPGELRPVTIEMNVSRFAEGSCLIRAEHTHILCAASVEEGVPRFMKDSGKGWITAEYAMLPRSCEKRIPRDISRGMISGRSHEIQRLVGRALRSVVDFEMLGERTIRIDCDVLQGDGGTRCAAITGSFVALYQAIRKLIDKGVIKKNPIRNYVAAVSVGIVNGVPTLDLNYQEDSHAEVDMNVVMTDKGKFIEVQGTAETNPFSDSDMQKMLFLAKAGIKQLIKIQKKTLM
jgi:ribonuclease PH